MYETSKRILLFQVFIVASFMISLLACEWSGTLFHVHPITLPEGDSKRRSTGLYVCGISEQISRIRRGGQGQKRQGSQKWRYSYCALLDSCSWKLITCPASHCPTWAALVMPGFIHPVHTVHTCTYSSALRKPYQAATTTPKTGEFFFLNLHLSDRSD